MSDIDPVEYGKLTATVESLDERVKSLEADIKQLLELANKGKGGLWMMNSGFVMLGGIGAWIIEHFVKK